MSDSSFSVGFRNCDLMLPAGVMFSKAEIQHVPQAWIRSSWSTGGTDYLQLDSNLLLSPEMQSFYWWTGIKPQPFAALVAEFHGGASVIEYLVLMFLPLRLLKFYHHDPLCSHLRWAHLSHWSINAAAHPCRSTKASFHFPPQDFLTEREYGHHVLNDGRAQEGILLVGLVRLVLWACRRI